MRFTTIKQTCTACPSQWDAWDEDGTYYYVRYRWGFLSVNRGDVMGEEIYYESLGDDFDGFMPTDEMVAHLTIAGILEAHP